SLQLPIASSTPLLPKIAPQTATNPLLQILKGRRHLAEAVIRPPAEQSLSQTGSRSDLPSQTVRAFEAFASILPSADFCTAVRGDFSPLSPARTGRLADLPG